MIGCDRPDSLFNGLVSVEANLVHKAVQSLARKVRLDFAEDSLYGVQFWGITDIENILYVQPRPPLLQVFGLMDVQLIHVQRDRRAFVSGAELFEEVEELLIVYRCIVSLAQSHAVFLSHGRDHGLLARVDFLLINGQVSVLPRKLT